MDSQKPKYAALAEELDADNEHHMLDHLLSGVKRQRRRRTLFRLQASVVVIVAGLGLFALHRSSNPASEVFTETQSSQEPPHWTEIPSTGSFREISSLNVVTIIETDLTSEIVEVDDKRLIDLFAGQPSMLAEASGESPKRFWLLAEHIQVHKQVDVHKE